MFSESLWQLDESKLHAGADGVTPVALEVLITETKWSMTQNIKPQRGCSEVVSSNPYYQSDDLRQGFSRTEKSKEALQVLGSWVKARNLLGVWNLRHGLLALEVILPFYPKHLLQLRRKKEAKQVRNNQQMNERMLVYA